MSQARHASPEGSRDGMHPEACAVSVADPAPPPAAPRAGWVLAATVLASSLSSIDGTVVNVGLPTIGSAFRGEVAGLQWVIDAYLLPLSALVLFGGALGDRFGRRLLLLTGIAVFTLGSIICAAAPDLPALDGGRIVQGIGAALLLPNSLAVLGDTFSGPARGRAIGIWAAAGAATAGVGPLVGGWLIDLAGWRTIFTVNLPVAGAALLLTAMHVPRGAPPRRVPLDPTGALLATAALGLLTAGLVVGAGPAGWTAPAVASLALGAVLFGGFVAWEGRRKARAMMPLALFASRDFAGLTLFTLLLYGALGALFVLLPFGVMRVGGAEAVAAGATLLPVTVSLAVLSPRLGGLAGRIGARPLLAAGSSAVAAGLLLLARVDAGAGYWTGLLPPLGLIGLGLAAAVAPLTTAVLASVDPSLTGTASGCNSAVARAGGLVGTACLGRVLASSGEGLVEACHVAAVAAAAACLAASGCALLVGRDNRDRGPAAGREGS